MKQRILFVNEASFLNTGYSTYGREVLKRLHKSDKYEIAELACYAHHTDPRLQGIPWRVYCNLPDSDNQEQVNHYNSIPTNAFGEWRFEEVANHFKPDIVCDIRDFWMMDFEERSPYRPFYHWVIMPTVDASPQAEQWLATYANADRVLTYQDWSGQVLQKESGGIVKWVGSAPPAADEYYRPVPNKSAHKKALGLEGINIVGTIMRNQRRKLYPDLFAAFQKFLADSGRKDTYLYCHVSFPDNGWDIPQLLKEYGIASKVIFTYQCTQCNYIFPTTFQDAVTVCRRCNQPSAGLCSVQRGPDSATLSQIVNLFDVYVQFSNSEGFGMPQVEAAACGVPVMSVDYSGMTDIVRKLKGYPLKVQSFYKEMETGCMRAVPNVDYLASRLTEFFNKPESIRLMEGSRTRLAYEEHYSWDKTAAKWDEVFQSLKDAPKASWDSSPRIANPDTHIPNNLTNHEYVRWLITNVLRDESKLNSYMELRLLRDLNYGVSLGGTAGMYFNEHAHMFSRPVYKPFSRENAYEQMKQLCLHRNYWENKRVSTTS